MPRHARIVAAGYPMHAIVRGIDRTAIFFAEDNYRAFLTALGAADAVIIPHPLYLALAEADETRRSHYRSLFVDEIPEGALAALREATNGAFALGSDRFQRQIAAMVGRRT